MDRIAFGKKTSSGQRPRVDRFVQPRDSFVELQRRSSWGTNSTPSVDIWHAKYRQQKVYIDYLDEAFGLEPIQNKNSTENKLENSVQAWPCVPRKKSYLCSADSILDLPTYSYAAFPELLDWSNDNILVAALGNHYHKWSWRTQSLISHGFVKNTIQCCKFDPRGELLVLGTNTPIVELHNNEHNKCFSVNWCKCKDHDEKCTITALDWSPTGNSFVSGCSRGQVVSYNRSCLMMRWYRASRNPVLMVRVSPDARHLATTGVNANIILILSWPFLNLLSSIKSHLTIKTFAWHPWRSAFLGVGAVSSNLQARIGLWDAPTLRIKELQLGRTQLNIDTMLFSHRTGELVLSLWNSEISPTNPMQSSQLVVLSDPETVVDQWGEGRSGIDRIRTMIFSPDGTKLATATADEDLVIWNFLPEDKCKKKKNKPRRFSALPVYLDEVFKGYSLR